jgi:hypothetical protein
MVGCPGDNTVGLLAKDRWMAWKEMLDSAGHLCPLQLCPSLGSGWDWAPQAGQFPDGPGPTLPSALFCLSSGRVGHCECLCSLQTGCPSMLSLESQDTKA